MGVNNMDIEDVIRENSFQSTYTNKYSDDGLNLYNHRLQYRYDGAQTRMIKNKAKTVREVIYRSYYGANIQVMDSGYNCRVAFYPRQSGYDIASDEKLVYAEFKDNIKVGDVLYWKATDSYWLIYQRNESELAFFEGSVMHCSNYMLSGIDGDLETYAAISVKAFNDTDLFDETLVERDTSVLTIRIPDSGRNRSYFKIGERLKIEDTYWKIRGVNWIGSKGIITITAVKSIEISEENLIKMREEAAPPIIDESLAIIGPDKIKPKQTVKYELNRSLEGYDETLWSISENNYIEKIILDRAIEITWTNIRKGGTFTISYGNTQKEVKVESFM